MRTEPRGSYAAHMTPSRYDGGPSAGHTLDGFHDERRPWLAILLACAVFAMIAGYVSARGGSVDRTHYEVTHAR